MRRPHFTCQTSAAAHGGGAVGALVVTEEPNSMVHAPVEDERTATIVTIKVSRSGLT